MAKRGKRVIGKLEASKIANAKRGRYEDGGGLRLVVRANGSMYWEFRFNCNRKAVSMHLGPFPDVTLVDARDAAHECRKLLRQKKDPREARGAKFPGEAAGSTFGDDTDDFLKDKGQGWSPTTKVNYNNCLKHVRNATLIDGRIVDEVLTREVDIDVMRTIFTRDFWREKNPTAKVARRLVEQILDYATARKHRTGENPARWRGSLGSVLSKPSDVHQKQPRPSLHFLKAPAYLADVHRSKGLAAPALEFAMQHGPHRIEVVANAEWPEFKPVETPEGVKFADRRFIPIEKMKGYKKIKYPNRKIYEEPLTQSQIEILKRQYKIRESKYVFPGKRHGTHITRSAVLKLAKSLTTDEITTHGFRSTFESWADDRTLCEDMVKEMSLGHSVGKDETEKAYRRADLFAKRRLLMEAWGEYLETGRDVAVNINERFMERMNGGSQVEAAHTVTSAEPIANDGVHPRLSRIVIVDLEASGLGSASFPTEIGWAMFREDGSIQSGSCLIRPSAKWVRYRNAWDLSAERLTGITKEMLNCDGVSPSEAFWQFMAAAEDRDIFSDSPDFDYHWFCMLGREADCDFGEDGGSDFFGDLTRLMDEMSLTVAFGDMPRHRAEADARRLLMGLRNRDTQNGLGRAA